MDLYKKGQPLEDGVVQYQGVVTVRYALCWQNVWPIIRNCGFRSLQRVWSPEDVAPGRFFVASKGTSIGIMMHRKDTGLLMDTRMDRPGMVREDAIQP